MQRESEKKEKRKIILDKLTEYQYNNKAETHIRP